MGDGKQIRVIASPARLDFGMPVADHGMNGFFDPFICPYRIRILGRKGRKKPFVIVRTEVGNDCRWHDVHQSSGKARYPWIETKKRMKFRKL